MRRNDAEQIGEMIRKFFRQNALEAPLNEYRLIQAWKDVVGWLPKGIKASFASLNCCRPKGMPTKSVLP